MVCVCVCVCLSRLVPTVPSSRIVSSASQPVFAVLSPSKGRPFQILWSALPLGRTALALKVCTPACVRLDLSPQQPHTRSHTDTLSLSHSHNNTCPFSCAANPPCSLVCPSSLILDGTPKQETNKQPTSPKSHRNQYKQTSPARPSGTSLRSATSTFITQLTTEHSRSIRTARGPLSVSYKGEREGGGKKRITEPHPRSHQTGPGSSNSAPISLVAQTTNTQDLPWATWAELAPRSPESRHATLTASLFRHFHPRPPGAAFALASLPRQPY